MNTAQIRRMTTIEPELLAQDLPPFMEALVEGVDGIPHIKPLSACRAVLTEGYFSDDGMLPVLRHPLLVMVPALLDGMDEHFVTDDLECASPVAMQFDPVVRLLFNAKRALELLQANQLSLFVFAIERPFRLDALLWLTESGRADALDDKAFTELVFQTYTDSESPGVNRWVWEHLMTEAKGRLGPSAYTTDAGVLEDLPDTITVYRGTHHPESEMNSLQGPGLSWTLDRDQAVWFSRRFAHKSDKADSQILVAEIDKSDVIGHLTDRGESEIVLNPRLLRGLAVEPAVQPPAFTRRPSETDAEMTL